jgi:AcrR family transcriptional regulator
MPDDGALGLRERKKLATRTALSEAALRLAVDRGLENVLVEDIAAAANVSPRTFNNYFSSKEQAIVSLVFARVAQLREAVAEQPADEPLWTAIANAAGAQVPLEGDAAEWKRWARLIRDTPALEAEQLKAYAAIERSLAVAIAERTGTDVHRDLFPTLAACAAVGAIRGALRYWLDTDEDVPYDALLQHAISNVGSGLPDPSVADVAAPATAAAPGAADPDAQ